MNADADDSPETLYHVVINDEEQYSIWPTERDLPPGWRVEGFTGAKPDCLAHIDEVWTDMRPLSLRRYMEQMGDAVEDDTEAEPGDTEEPLVTRLSRGDHPVEVSLRPERTATALRGAIDVGYLYLRFTETRGRTELGVRLDPSACDLTDADFDAGSGRARLIGDLTLDFEPVRCSADIDLATMAGTGRLSIREPAP